MFVSNLDGGRIGEYTTFGAPVDSALITGLVGPRGLAVPGGNLFVASDNPTSESSRIGKYTISGATVNPALIQKGFFGFVEGIAVSGDKLFLADLYSGLVAEYTTSGALMNAALITGLNGPSGIAVFGGHLFVTNFGNGTVGEYDAATGAPIDTALVSGLNGPFGIAVSGGNLFVTSQVFGQDTGTIGEYTILGETVNTRLITGLSEPVGIAVVSGSVPDASSTWTLLLMGLTVIFGINLVRHQLA